MPCVCEMDMSGQKFNIIFCGEIAQGLDKDKARQALGLLCGFDQATLDRLFSGGTAYLKKNIDEPTAKRYLAALEKTGARCYLKPVSSPVQRICTRCKQAQGDGITCAHCGSSFEKTPQKHQIQIPAQQQSAAVPRAPKRPPASWVNPEVANPSLFSKIGDYFSLHQEQAFLLKAMVTITLILLLRNYFSGLLLYLGLAFPIFFLLYIRMHALAIGESPLSLLRSHITVFPVMYAEGDRKREGIAWITYGIILANLLTYYGFQARFSPEQLNRLAFLPGDLNPRLIPLSAFTHMFLHSGPAHLWGNMLFLWAVGTVVEKRIGALKLGLFYLISGLVAAIFFVAVERLFLSRSAHLIGASGAIAGVMGLFAIRCYFKSMIFPLPLLGIFSLILPISLKVRLNTLVVIGLFFLSDLGRGIEQIQGQSSSNIGHWAHIGGMLCGTVLGIWAKFGHQAMEERHMDLGSEAWSNNKISLDDGEKSLRLVLKKNPVNTKALLVLARILSKYSPTEEAEVLYLRAINLLVPSHPRDATEAFREFFLTYRKGVSPSLLFRFAGIYTQQGDLEMASHCLGLLLQCTDIHDELRSKALMQYARVLEEMGLGDLAGHYYEEVLKQFPASPLASHVKNRMSRAAV